MTRVLSELITRNLDNDRWKQLTHPFICELDTLKKVGLKCRVEAPIGFVQDFESVPIVRGRNIRGGVIHDYLSCIDSDPIVTKEIAAACYFELNQYTDSIDHQRGILIKLNDWARRWSKWAVVYVWPFYFHQRRVMATPKEITGLECDPYVTIEKLDAAIVESKETTAKIKEVPAEVDTKAEMVKASEQVTSDLKDAKRDIKDTL